MVNSNSAITLDRLNTERFLEAKESIKEIIVNEYISDNWKRGWSKKSEYKKMMEYFIGKPKRVFHIESVVER